MVTSLRRKIFKPPHRWFIHTHHRRRLLAQPLLLVTLAPTISNRKCVVTTVEKGATLRLSAQNHLCQQCQSNFVFAGHIPVQ